MTKSLTEQWKNGELNGFYYISDHTGKIIYRYLNGIKPDADFIKYFKEVLAPVPSYEEWKESQKKRALWFEERAKIREKANKKIKLLKEQLVYALETMSQIAKFSDDKVNAVQCATAICLIGERLKEIEEVK